jgi:hypothetical protein
MLATVIVGIAFVMTLPFLGNKVGSLPQVILIMGLVGVAVSFLPVFHEAREVFMDRWTTAAVSTNGDAWGGIFSRIFAGFTQPLFWATQAPIFGNGIGVGSNVGARLLQGKVGFMLAEDEWGKVFLELGPLLGGAFIAFRIAIACHMALKAFHALFTNRDNLPVLILSACAIAMIMNQWAPPTILGFAVLGAGLLLAAAKSPDVPDEEETEDDEDAEEELEEEDVPIDVLHPPVRETNI